MPKPTDLEGRFDQAMKKGEKQDRAKRTTSTGYMPRGYGRIPEVSAREEKKVMKSIEKKGHYEMSDKRKKALSDAWEKAKHGTGFMK